MSESQHWSFEDVVEYTRHGLAQRLKPGLRVKLIRFGRQERFRNVLVFLLNNIRKTELKDAMTDRWKPHGELAREKRNEELRVVADLITNWELAEDNFDEPLIPEVNS